MPISFIALLKPLLESLFYIAGIMVSYKALKALNIYIDKNENNHRWK